MSQIVNPTIVHAALVVIAFAIVCALIAGYMVVNRPPQKRDDVQDSNPDRPLPPKHGSFFR